MADLREIGPTFFFAPPRTFEQMLTRVMIRMEDAGFLKRRLFHYFIGVARRYGETILNKQPVPLHGRLLVLARQCPGLCAAEERARALERARRLHRRRGDRPGPVLVLPLARHEPEAALRPDRSVPLSHRAAGRPDLFRHRRARAAERRFAYCRQRRGAVQVARHVRQLFQGRRQDQGDDDAGRLREDRRRRLLRRQDRASENHRPRQGCRQAQGRHAVPAEIHREQAEVLSQHPRGRWPTATAATSSR